MLKEIIISYITGAANTCSKFSENKSIYILNDLIDFVADLKEEQNSDSEEIYVKQIVELQNDNEKLSSNNEILIKENGKLFAENEKMHNRPCPCEPVPIFLDETKELQELKSKLAESEKAAEYSNFLWDSVCKKLTLENEKLSKELLFRKVR